MSPGLTHYELLQVPSTATSVDILRAYRRAVMACHPDRHPGNPHAVARFKQITAAFEVLSDPDRRREYDLALLYWGSEPRGPHFGRTPSVNPTPTDMT